MKNIINIIYISLYEKNTSIKGNKQKSKTITNNIKITNNEKP